MVSNSRPFRWKDLLASMATNGSHTRGPQNEDIGAAEQVLAIVRKEGEEVAKPEDTRCRAKRGNGRCQNDITFSMEMDAWLRWCEEHAEQEAKAREEGGPRVEAFSGSDDEE